MAYSTLTDLKKLIPETVLIQLTDDENTGSVNQGRIDEAIAKADGEINAYCAGRYTVPFAIVPDVIRGLSIDLAIYHLYSRRLEAIPETRAERYKAAMGQIRDIAKGVITLGVAAEPPKPADSGPKANKTDDDRAFTKTKLEGY